MSTDRRLLVLAASLLLNVFLIGIVAGHMWGAKEGPSGGKPNPGALVPPEHVRALPKDERKLFTTTMASHREAIRVAHQDQQRLRQAIEMDIAAPIFDHDKVAADFKGLRDGALNVQEKTQEALLDALAQLSPASRAALVAHQTTATAPEQN